VTEERRGVLLGAAAYLLWGLFPLYWPLLEPATPLEILAHRFVWSLVVVLGVIVMRRRLGPLRDVLHDRRRLGLLIGASVVIALNWYAYIYGVNTDRVVETSLGYFINPLVTLLLGVVVLRERLRRAQWVAVGVAALAVAVLAVDYGRPPWIALVLAGSFGTYGLIKKTTAVGPAEGLAVESGALLIPALGYLIWLETTGAATFGHAGVGNALLLALAGVVTSVPLLLFAGAARRVPLVTLGLLQYLAPTLQFLIGVLVLDEEMPGVRWIGFGLVWLALVLFTADQLSAHRARRRAAASPEPVVL
jgi:chloramphenicol-sensitive protein RarD